LVAIECAGISVLETPASGVAPAGPADQGHRQVVERRNHVRSEAVADLDAGAFLAGPQPAVAATAEVLGEVV
jgi:hypothetical protein